MLFSYPCIENCVLTLTWLKHPVKEMGSFLDWFTNPERNPKGRPSGVAGQQRDKDQADWIQDSVGSIPQIKEL